MAERKPRKGLAIAPEPARNYRPRDIASLIAPVVRPTLRRRGAGLASVAEDWEALVGPEIAAMSQPVKLAAGTLTLACAGPGALELQHRAPSLIARLNLALGGTPIERLRFVAGFLTVQPKHGKLRAPDLVGSAPPPGLPENELGAALAKLHHALAKK